MTTEVISEVDLDRPSLRRKHVTVSNDATTRPIIDAGEFGVFVTDEPEDHGGQGSGPSPLQAVLGSLCGCESVTFSRTAEEMGFAYDDVEFEAAFTIDVRGRKGDRSVRPHFQTVRVQATVITSESEDRLREVVEETEARCPVFIGGLDGLGFYILVNARSFSHNEAMVAVLALAAVGVAILGGVKWATGRFAPWYDPTQSN